MNVTDTVDFTMMLLILINIILLGSSRIIHSIRLVAAQGVLLGILPLLISGKALPHHIELAGIALCTITVKSIIFPMLMMRIIRDTNDRREVAPFLGYGPVMALGMIALACSFWVSHRLRLPPPYIQTSLLMPSAFFGILAGLLLIISRRKAIMQVIGYLVLENGIFTIGIVAGESSPLLVELGILLDVFVAIFVMGITLFHINREFDHIDTDEMMNLKDSTD